MDITERLIAAMCSNGCGSMKICICAIAEDAKDEIIRLRAERDQWKELYLAAMRIVAEFEGTFSSPPRDGTK